MSNTISISPIANPDSTQEPAARQVRGACPHDCPDTCSLLTTVEGGVATRVQGNPEHPHTGGVLCNKVSRYTERTYHPERLLGPLKRSGPKGSGQFEPVSWEAALADIAARLKAIAARDPEAILPYSYAGTMGQVQGESMAGRFFNRLGASLLDRTICASAGGEALTQTLGGKVGMRVEFFAESKLIIIWGSNSIGSNLHFWRYAQQAKRDGAKLICIDPRRSETAEKCHEHIALLPGTDAALALALMHELITHDWLDHDYIARHTLGWQSPDGGLRERALQWSPERAAAVCGVPAGQIRSLARDYGECMVSNQPAAIRLNYGMQRVHGGGNAARAVACLPALTGAWRHRAGGVLLSSSGLFPVDKAALQRPDLLNGRQPRTINMSTIGNALLAPASPRFGPRIEAVIVYNSNPVAVAPESGKVVQGFAREDLFTVVLEHFQTDTADYADYVLPATTQLEHWDVHSAYGHTDALLNRPAIAPHGPGQAQHPDIPRTGRPHGFGRTLLCRQRRAAVPRGLRRQGRLPATAGQRLCHAGPARCALRRRQVPHGLGPLRILQRAAGGRRRGRPARPRAQSRGRRHIGRVPAGHDLAAGAQLPQFQLRQRQKPARHRNRAAAGNPRRRCRRARHHHGAVVKVFNQRGENTAVKAEVSARARPGVVNGMGIWWRKLGLDGTNVNELTSQHLTDMGRGPVFYDCLVQVQREAEAA
jgi:anaerobic selenocysteine-containing dehydrogenase